MEAWVPLMEIFLNSPCPESEASTWLQQHFNPSSNAAISLSTSSFLSLLIKPSDILLGDPSSPPPSKATNIKSLRILKLISKGMNNVVLGFIITMIAKLVSIITWMQTLPNAVQARILSFLVYEHMRFSKHELCKLARDILGSSGEIDFWVRRGARQLLDVVSDSNYKWVSGLNLDSEEDKGNEDFECLPDWLKDVANESGSDLPWLPMDVGIPFGACGDEDDMLVDDEEGEDENLDKTTKEDKVVHLKVDVMNTETQERAACLKSQILNYESTSNAVELASEVCNLCIGNGVDSLAVLGLIEPWNADDETVSVLMSHLSDGTEEELGWLSNVLCSFLLPKLLTLEEPASRVLVTAAVEYCKMHQRATVYALLFPLILRKEGINNSICDVITRIVRECLHPAHVSAFCQNLLCGDEDRCKFVCLPCHQSLISNELVWTEALFNLFQNILNHNVHLTQDAIDQLICQAQEFAERFSGSLKFGNFLLCLVTKCAPSLQRHKISLTEAVQRTSTFVTKSILTKLAIM